MSLKIVNRTVEALKMMKQDPLESVANKLHVNQGNLSRDVKDLRKQVDFWRPIIDVVEKEGLLEKNSEKQRKQKYLQTLTRKAEQGSYIGRPFKGYEIKNGVPIPKRELEKIERLLRGLLAGKRLGEIARETGFSFSKIYRIRSDTRYKGEYDYRGKTYRITQNNFKPLLTAEEWNELQRKIGPGGLLPPGYEWYDGKRVLKPGAKEMYQKIFAMRLNREPYTYKKIGEEVGLSRETIRKIIRDRRITGWVEVDGNLVDSGFEPAIDEETWKAAQKVRAETRAERRAEQAKNVRQKILALMPAFRWELFEKANATKRSIEHNVKRLLKDKWLKQREDALLQRGLEPFPEKVVVTFNKKESVKRLKIFAVLQSESMSTSKLTRLLGFKVDWHIKKMEKEGVVQRIPPQKGGKWRISNDWAAPVEAALKRHQCSMEISPYEIKWLEFTRPKKGLVTLFKILKVLLRNDASNTEIMKETAIPERTLIHQLRILRNAEIIEKHPPTQYGKWRIKNDWRPFIEQKSTLARPRVPITNG